MSEEKEIMKMLIENAVLMKESIKDFIDSLELDDKSKKFFVKELLNNLNVLVNNE